MKNSATYERRFKALIARLRKTLDGPAATLTDPAAELVWSILLEDATEGTAKVAMARLTGQFVDLNELRVSRPEELVEVLPATLSDGLARARRIIDSLQAAFNEADTLDLTYLRDESKREARSFVAGLPGMTPFVEGRVCLLALGIFAMPVDRTLVGILQKLGAAHSQTDPKDTQGFLERIVPAKDAPAVAAALESLRQAPDQAPGERPAARARKK